MVIQRQMTNFTQEIQKYDKNTSHIRQQKEYLDLLLLADEQESMIDRYLERGEMFILSDNDTVKASCVITCEDNLAGVSLTLLEFSE